MVNLLKLITRNTPKWNSLLVLFHCGNFDRKETSFWVSKYYVNTSLKWNHPKWNICASECKGNMLFKLRHSKCHSKRFWNRKIFMVPFYGWGATTSRIGQHWGGSLLFTNKFPEFRVLILSNSKGWKAKSTLESPSGFEPPSGPVPLDWEPTALITRRWS